jgi:hypothetical protein
MSLPMLSSRVSLAWLRHRVGVVKQEHGDLFVILFSDTHRPMNARSRLLPFHLPGRDLDALALSSITALNRQSALSVENFPSLA